jgi:diacylglycerol kinase (ATP)
MSRALPPYPKKATGFLGAFVHAWNGLLHTVVHQRNMRVHVVAAMLVALVGSGIRLDLAEKVTLIFCVLLVFFAEVLNSALEQLVDLAIQQFDEKARITKDAAAAGVLVLAIGTVVIFAAVLVHNWATIAANTEAIRRQVLFGLPLAALVGTLTLPFRRPLAVDLLIFLLALGLLGVTATWSTSQVFTALGAGVVVLAFASSLHRRSEARGTKR